MGDNDDNITAGQQKHQEKKKKDNGALLDYTVILGRRRVQGERSRVSRGGFNAWVHDCELPGNISCICLVVLAHRL